MFKESIQCLSTKFKKKGVSVFQECFNNVLFCDLVVAWISSQLPQQKEGLFYHYVPRKKNKLNFIQLFREWRGVLTVANSLRVGTCLSKNF